MQMKNYGFIMRTILPPPSLTYVYTSQWAAAKLLWGKKRYIHAIVILCHSEKCLHCMQFISLVIVTSIDSSQP